MKQKANGELVYKPLLSPEDNPIEFIPQWVKDQLTPMDKSITLILEQHSITTDVRKHNIPSVNVLLIDNSGKYHMLAQDLKDIKVIQPCSTFPDWDYEAYLQSNEWKERRNEYFSKNGCRCSICSSSTKIQLHHLNYKRLGYEKDSDLISLCAYCHGLLHQYKDQYLDRIGDLAKMWYYPTRNIENANTNGDLINRFIVKYKPQLDYVFNGLPPVLGRIKNKFVSELLSSMRSLNEHKLLPYHIVIKLIKSI